MVWHRRKWADLAVRACGAILLACAVRLALTLPGPAAVALNGGARAIDFALAALAFLCGTSGAASVFVGAHLFDPVALGPRWQRFRR